MSLLAPRTLDEPLIGTKVGDSYVYGLCQKCTKQKNKKKCKHNDKSRAITSVLCWNEINYLVAMSYKIVTVYETYVYSKQAPIFEKFVKLLSVQKLKHSMPSKSQSYKDYCQEINDTMKLDLNIKLEPVDIEPNDTIRSYYKEYLNGFLGKLSQQTNKTKALFVRSQSQLTNVFYSSHIDDIFPLDKACVLFVRNSTKTASMNRQANSILYSYILAYARIYMHKNMMKLKKEMATIYSINNDAIYFTMPKTKMVPLRFSQSFGSFKYEFEGCTIIEFLSFGQKSSSITFITKDKQIKKEIKARGFCLQSSLVNSILSNVCLDTMLKSSLSNEPMSFKIPQIRSKKSIKTLSVKETLLMCEFSNEITQCRIIAKDGSTKPYGYV